MRLQELASELVNPIHSVKAMSSLLPNLCWLILHPLCLRSLAAPPAQERLPLLGDDLTSALDVALLKLRCHLADRHTAGVLRILWRSASFPFCLHLRPSVFSGCNCRCGCLQHGVVG